MCTPSVHYKTTTPGKTPLRRQSYLHHDSSFHTASDTRSQWRHSWAGIEQQHSYAKLTKLFWAFLDRAITPYILITRPSSLWHDMRCSWQPRSVVYSSSRYSSSHTCRLKKLRNFRSICAPTCFSVSLWQKTSHNIDLYIIYAYIY